MRVGARVEKRLAYPERNSAMGAPFTIGIEEEYQMVDRQTGQLSPRIHIRKRALHLWRADQSGDAAINGGD